MPGLNQKGPDGNGPMTGRQRGMCKRTEELPLRGRGKNKPRNADHHDAKNRRNGKGKRVS